MCGLAGYYGSRDLDEDVVQACLRAMHHRGPDAARAWRHRAGNGRRLNLLHARLKIIDLDPRADQPFHDGARVLATNGEIYNYRELRAELETGVPFATESDTEVLVRAIGTWGLDAALDRCEGMWAFALYDRVHDTLTLVRDRFGEKPLYVLEDETGVYFGSEPKFIAILRGRPLRVNMDHVFRYLVNGYKALYKDTSRCFFDELHEVPAATAIRFRADGGRDQHAYWRPDLTPDESMDRDDAVAQVREALIRAVDLRLRSDVPLAFLMSGGVDSNSLIGIARTVLDREVHAFTVVNTDHRYDERAVVEQARRELDIDHTEIPLETDGFLDQLRTLVRQHDGPVLTITYFAQWRLLEQVAAAGYRVSISGTGADELFTGYYDHHNAYLYEMHGEAGEYAGALAAWRRHVRPLVRNPYLSNPRVFIEDPAQRDHIFLDADEFARFLTVGWHEPFAETRYAGGLLRNRMLNELFHEAVPPILHEDDLNAMSWSIENRSPFLDRQLFDLCQRIPTRHLIRDGFAKSVLRDAMRGIAPACVLRDRRKVGFNAPIQEVLDVTDPEVRAALLDQSPIYDHVRRDRIETLLTPDPLPNSRSKFLFYFLNCKMFLEEYAA